MGNYLIDFFFFNLQCFSLGSLCVLSDIFLLEIVGEQMKPSELALITTEVYMLWEVGLIQLRGPSQPWPWILLGLSDGIPG